MWNRKRQWYLRRAALALTVAAVAAPGAQAYVANDGGGSGPAPHVRPDDRGVRVGGPAQSQPQIVASDQSGLDWGDVGIAGGLTAALAGLGIAAARVSRRVEPAES